MPNINFLEMCDIFKRRRTENWLRDDKLLLQKLIRERVNIIENKKTDSNTNERKKNSWEDLLKNYNRMCKGTQRTVQQLKTQWAIIKMHRKKQKFLERRDIPKTADEPPLPMNVGDQSSTDSSLLSNEFVIDVNEFDSDIELKTSKENVLDDVFHVQLNSSNVSSNDTRFTPMNCTTQETVDYWNTEKRNDFEIVESAYESVKSIKSENTNTGASTSRSKEAMPTFERECKESLHAVQMEIEAKRGRNLDMKYEVLQAKLLYYKRKNAESDSSATVTDAEITNAEQFTKNTIEKLGIIRNLHSASTPPISSKCTDEVSKSSCSEFMKSEINSFQTENVKDDNRIEQLALLVNNLAAAFRQMTGEEFKLEQAKLKLEYFKVFNSFENFENFFNQ